MPPVKKAKAQSPKKKENKGKSVTKKLKADEHILVVSGQLQKKIQKQQQREDNKRGIVFIKNLPHGFFEEQLKGYFEQFGKVTRLRLARSSKTGGSKGYAFVEFQYPEVAQVAAETMNNYLMFQKLVKAEYIPPEKQKFNYFKTTLRKVTNKAGKEIYVSSKTRHIVKRMKEHNNWSENNYQRRAGRALKKLENLKKKFSHLGIDFSKILVPPQRIQEETKEHVESIDEEDGNAIKLDPKNNEKKSGALIVTVAQRKTKKGKLNEELTTSDLLGNTNYNSEDDDDFDPTAENSDEGTSDEDSYLSDKGKLKLKNQSVERCNKNKSLTTADLLGTTIDEDSSDDDFLPPEKLNTVKLKLKNQSVERSKKNKSLTTADLLGTTIDEDSADDDFIPPAKLNTTKLKLKNRSVERSKKNKSLTTADLLGTTIDEDSADDDFIPPEKLNTVKKISKKSSTAKKMKQDLTQKKPSLKSGKIQKPSFAGVVKKVKPRMSVVSKSKKTLQLLAAKEIAKPLKTLGGKVNKSPLSKVGLLRKSAKKL